jgi:hypothetical protein
LLKALLAEAEYINIQKFIKVIINNLKYIILFFLTIIAS